MPVLCRLQDLPDAGARGFAVEQDGVRVPILVVRRGQAVHGYHNQCPHTGINLHWTPDRFLDSSATLIQCATHGALFRMDDGHCVHGPCSGQALRPVPLQVSAGGDITHAPAAHQPAPLCRTATRRRLS